MSDHAELARLSLVTHAMAYGADHETAIEVVDSVLAETGQDGDLMVVAERVRDRAFPLVWPDLSG